jgi:hypothetical protein
MDVVYHNGLRGRAALSSAAPLESVDDLVVYPDVCCTLE